MIGQKELQAQLDAYIANSSLSHSIIFEGEYGCGKHTLAKELTEKLHLDLVDISDNLTQETFDNIRLSPCPCTYLIDTQKISIKDQNSMLKFLEEPPRGCYIILLTENKQRLLQTVVNRCQTFVFGMYSADELKCFEKGTAATDALKYSHTPGMLLKMQSVDISKYHDFALKLFEKISIASFSNVLSIPDKFYYKDEDSELLEFHLFCYILVNVANELYSSNRISFKEFDLTREFYTSCSISRINHKQLFEHYLFQLKLAR